MSITRLEIRYDLKLLVADIARLLLMLSCQTIARHVLQVHMNTHVKEREAAGDIDIQKMRGYISYCKT